LEATGCCCRLWHSVGYLVGNKISERLSPSSGLISTLKKQKKKKKKKKQKKRRRRRRHIAQKTTI
jgi:hypothetical protein